MWGLGEGDREVRGLGEGGREVWGLGEGEKEVRGCGSFGGSSTLLPPNTLSSLSLTHSLSLSLFPLFPLSLSSELLENSNTLSLSLSENSLSTNNMQAKLFVPLLLPVKSPAECCQCILNVIITPVEKE